MYRSGGGLLPPTPGVVVTSDVNPPVAPCSKEEFVPLKFAKSKLDVVVSDLRITNQTYTTYIKELEAAYTDSIEKTKAHYETYIIDVKGKAKQHIDILKIIREDNDKKMESIIKEKEESLESLRDALAQTKSELRDAKYELENEGQAHQTADNAYRALSSLTNEGRIRQMNMERIKQSTEHAALAQAKDVELVAVKNDLSAAEQVIGEQKVEIERLNNELRAAADISSQIEPLKAEVTRLGQLVIAHNESDKKADMAFTLLNLKLKAAEEMIDEQKAVIEELENYSESSSSRGSSVSGEDDGDNADEFVEAPGREQPKAGDDVKGDGNKVRRKSTIRKRSVIKSQDERMTADPGQIEPLSAESCKIESLSAELDQLEPLKVEIERLNNELRAAADISSQIEPLKAEVTRLSQLLVASAPHIDQAKHGDENIVRINGVDKELIERAIEEAERLHKDLYMTRKQTKANIAQWIASFEKENGYPPSPTDKATINDRFKLLKQVHSFLFSFQMLSF